MNTTTKIAQAYYQAGVEAALAKFASSSDFLDDLEGHTAFNWISDHASNPLSDSVLNFLDAQEFSELLKNDLVRPSAMEDAITRMRMVPDALQIRGPSAEKNLDRLKRDAETFRALDVPMPGASISPELKRDLEVHLNQNLAKKEEQKANVDTLIRLQNMRGNPRREIY